MKKVILSMIIFTLLQIFIMPVTLAQDIPDNIYKWVLASPRASYYFNKEQIKFVVDDEGNVDTNIIEVPILEQYDWIKKEDIIDKRRWNGLDMTGFGDLWGYAGLVHINIKEQQVSYIYQMYLNSWWTPIWKLTKNDVIDLNKMSDKNLDKIFFETIIKYAQENKDQILKQQGIVIEPKENEINKKDEKLTEKEKVRKLLKIYNEKDKKGMIKLKKVVVEK